MKTPQSKRHASLRRAAGRMFAALALFCASNVRADSVFLHGGEKLIGRIVSEQPAKVVFESKNIGRIEIPRDRIERLERDALAPARAPISTNQAAASSATSGAPTNVFYPWLTPQTLASSNRNDWIQIKSGEWLRGRVKSLQDERLEFDSEELNLLSFDWKNIYTLRSPRLHSVGIENLKPQDGSVLVTTNEAQVCTPTTTNTYPRTGLLSITPTGDQELDKWSGKLSAGLSFRSGNTHETDVNTHVELHRRTPGTRLNLDYLGNYAKVNGVETEDNHRAIGQFDYFFSRRLYTRLPDVEYLRDPLQNLDHRLTLGAGVGYDLIKTPRTEWNVTVGPAWQRNWFNSVPDGGSATADSGALVLSTHFDFELTQRLDFIFDYRGQMSGKDTGNNTHHAVTTLEFEIRKRLKLDLSFQWDRIGSPQTESGGATPTPDDFRLITSLAFDF